MDADLGEPLCQLGPLSELGGRGVCEPQAPALHALEELLGPVQAAGELLSETFWQSAAFFGGEYEVAVVVRLAPDVQFGDASERAAPLRHADHWAVDEVDTPNGFL